MIRVARPLAAGAVALVLLGGCAAPGWRDRGAWRIEAESPETRVRFGPEAIEIDSPAGLSLWWRAPIDGPVAIRFEAMAVGATAADVSDLNAFWMAGEADGGPVSRTRSGAFADYDDLRTYYVGIGGNRNTTTRLRRYVGEEGNRPLLPDHDRSDVASLLTPGRWARIELIADGGRVAVVRDGVALFEWRDSAPYTRGHFAFRTTQSRWRIRNVRIAPIGTGEGQR